LTEKEVALTIDISYSNLFNQLALEFFITQIGNAQSSNFRKKKPGIAGLYLHGVING
jgi:hypothetical protein